MIMKKLNNKGFTLIELLAVIVILIAIIGIAIPSITASLERNKNKVNESKQQIIISAAELCISDNRNLVAINSSTCYISLDLLTSKGYITGDDKKDANGNVLSDNAGVKVEHTNGNVTKIEYVGSVGDNGCLDQ